MSEEAKQMTEEENDSTFFVAQNRAEKFLIDLIRATAYVLVFALLVVVIMFSVRLMVWMWG